MQEPTTSIDRRYSSARAEATPWATARQLLDDAQLSWVVTNRPGGGPHVTPVVALFVDDAVHFTTGDHEQKWKNLQGDRRVAVLTGSNEWDRGIDVIVEGVAVPVSDPAALERIAAVWRTRWDGRWRIVEVVDGQLRHRGDDGELEDYTIIAYRVEPTRAYAQAKGLFGHTRYDFTAPVSAG